MHESLLGLVKLRKPGVGVMSCMIDLQEGCAAMLSMSI